MDHQAIGTLALCLLACLVVLPPAVASSPDDWERIDDDDGIRVYKRDIPGSDLPGFRGETVIAAAIERLVAELKDYQHYTEWMHKCVAAERIRNISKDHSIDYNRTSAPWPVWDRDVVLESIWTFSPDGRAAKLEFRNTDPSLRAPEKHTVRMPHLTGFYKLWQLGPAQTKVVYQVEADPGGSLPTWLATRVTRDLPHDTLAALRRRVTRKH